jgi:hypothetical protein
MFKKRRFRKRKLSYAYRKARVVFPKYLNFRYWAYTSRKLRFYFRRKFLRKTKAGAFRYYIIRSILIKQNARRARYFQKLVEYAKEAHILRQKVLIAIAKRKRKYHKWVRF